MPGKHKNPRKSTQRHSAETRKKIGVGASKTRLNEMKECPEGCGVITNNGSMVRHLKSSHTFTCKITECKQTKHKGNGLCPNHWTLARTLSRYGLTIDDYAKMYHEQNSACKVCSKRIELAASGTGLPPSEVGTIDHDHKTGRVRGLLCHSCNIGIGHFKDDPDTMRAAIRYLEGGER